MPHQRANSPITFEPLSPSPSDIIFEESESENDEESRSSKRRRIEKLAGAYLAGEPLFIMTASLKGPFGPGWKNPWKKMRAEVPETIKKAQSVAPISPKPYLPEKSPVEQEEEARRGLSATNDHNAVESAARSIAVDDFVKAHTPIKKISRSNSEWLKRNDSQLKSRPNPQARTPSPTPASRPTRSPYQGQNTLRRPTPSTIREGTLGVPLDHSRSSSPRTTFTSCTQLENATSSERAQHYTMEAPERIEYMINIPRSSCNKREGPPEIGVRASKLGLGTSKTGKSANNKAISDMMRREVRTTDLRNPKGHKRRSLHTVPPSSNLASFEYRPSRSISTTKVSLPLNVEQISYEASQSHDKAKAKEFKKPRKRVSFRSSPDPKSSRDIRAIETESTRDQPISNAFVGGIGEIVQLPEKAPLPSPSNAVSHATTVPEESTGIGSTANLPSAQVVDVALDLPVQNISTDPSDSDALFTQSHNIAGEEDSVLQLSTQAAVTRAQLCFQDDLITPIEPNPPFSASAAHTPHNGSIKLAHPNPLQSVEQLSTQVMIDNITPFNFSTAKRTKPSASTPCYVNAKSAGSKLRTSWIHSSPSELRRPFPRPSPSHAAEDPQCPSSPASFPPRALSMSTSPEPDPDRTASSTSHYESAQSTSSKMQAPIPPNSKTSPVHVTSPSPSHQPSILCPGTATTTSTSVHQDAQPQQDLCLDGIEFNLDETLEDIGGYLHSWDIEKEIRNGASSGVV